MSMFIFPTVNDVYGAGSVGDGIDIKEDNFAEIAQIVGRNDFVWSGFTSSDGGGLVLDVASGTLFVSGYKVESSATENETLTASNTNYVYGQLTRDGSNNVTGMNIVHNTTGTTPTDGILLATVVTGASTITTITDSRRLKTQLHVLDLDWSTQTGTSTATGVTVETEILDHFERGTWTPVLWDNSNSSSESQAYVEQSGEYMRIGKFVFIVGRLWMMSLGSLTSSEGAKIGGLPFTSGNTQAASAVAIGYVDQMSVTAGESIKGYIPQNSNAIQLRLTDISTGDTALLISEMSASSIVNFSGLYVVD